MLPAVSDLNLLTHLTLCPESLHMKVELAAKVIAHHRQVVRTMKFLWEQFKLNMVRDVVILGHAHSCLLYLQPQRDGYFSQLTQILKEGKTTS
ncbi:hypothetical protein SKAU_G00249910 [Synaphobranchus kaupii]|uniref:Uncharacterized protein n=1 Tax=Synaphobranchus kaupii TaxID=118154 RepID=A0A9Q1F2R6_SYNKA|nr:hypothetical protein SKAU_G00249910 [Synaphobranchus kaupii]